jgi:hypothetical protein
MVVGRQMLWCIVDLMDRFAIFFPQFHRIRVNDLVWGSGFTDWALVATANAFGWWSRRAPSAGFYDLSQDSAIHAQFQLAAMSDLSGFGIYHYWFEDGPELDAVERWLLRSTLPENFEFFLIWANESWSKRWAGNDHETIKRIEVRPSRDSVRQHVAYLAPLLSLRSCRKWQGRPMFVFYRPEFFAKPDETVELYRQEFVNVDLEVSLGFFAKNRNDLPFATLFDFCYLFEPRLYFNTKGFGRWDAFNQAYRTLLRQLPYEKVEAISAWLLGGLGKRSRSYPFEDFSRYMSSPDRAAFTKNFACPVQNVVSCGWNNAPRYRDRFTELTTPSVEQLQKMLIDLRQRPLYDSKLPLLCNAWNEWSEGAAIEPCAYLGDRLLRCYVQSDKSPLPNSAA